MRAEKAANAEDAHAANAEAQANVANVAVQAEEAVKAAKSDGEATLGEHAEQATPKQGEQVTPSAAAALERVAASCASQFHLALLTLVLCDTTHSYAARGSRTLG